MTYGFKQSHFNYASRWKVDCDYLDKLSPSDKDWMARFLKEFYEGKTFPDHNLITDKKESYNRQNASQRCTMIRCHKAGSIGAEYNWNDHTNPPSESPGLCTDIPVQRPEDVQKMITHPNHDDLIFNDGDIFKEVVGI